MHMEIFLTQNSPRINFSVLYTHQMRIFPSRIHTFLVLFYFQRSKQFDIGQRHTAARRSTIPLDICNNLHVVNTYMFRIKIRNAKYLASELSETIFHPHCNSCKKGKRKMLNLIYLVLSSLNRVLLKPFIKFTNRFNLHNLVYKRKFPQGFAPR